MRPYQLLSRSLLCVYFVSFSLNATKKCIIFISFRRHLSLLMENAESVSIDVYGKSAAALVLVVCSRLLRGSQCFYEKIFRVPLARVGTSGARAAWPFSAPRPCDHLHARKKTTKVNPAHHQLLLP